MKKKEKIDKIRDYLSREGFISDIKNNVMRINSKYGGVGAIYVLTKETINSLLFWIDEMEQKV